MAELYLVILIIVAVGFWIYSSTDTEKKDPDVKMAGMEGWERLESGNWVQTKEVAKARTPGADDAKSDSGESVEDEPEPPPGAGEGAVGPRATSKAGVRMYDKFEDWMQIFYTEGAVNDVFKFYMRRMHDIALDAQEYVRDPDRGVDSLESARNSIREVDGLYDIARNIGESVERDGYHEFEGHIYQKSDIPRIRDALDQHDRFWVDLQKVGIIEFLVHELPERGRMEFVLTGEEAIKQLEKAAANISEADMEAKARELGFKFTDEGDVIMSGMQELQLSASVQVDLINKIRKGTNLPADPKDWAKFRTR